MNHHVQKDANMKYTYILHTKDNDFLIEECEDIFKKTGKRTVAFDSYECQIDCKEKNGYAIVEITLRKKIPFTFRFADKVKVRFILSRALAGMKEFSAKVLMT